ncbi:MAG: hypothetical protein RLN83_05055 [Balneola sp.]
MGKSENAIHTIADYSNGDVYLRMDGDGVNSPNPSGGGTVNCQYTAGPFEKFKFIKNDDNTYSIESVEFPGVYLRIDGRELSEDNKVGGIVNCQNGIGPWEKYKIKNHLHGYAIESNQFENVFLRMDSDNCQPKATPPGCGTVNASFGINMDPPVRNLFVISPPLDLD